MAINAPGDTPVRHRDDRVRDQRADAAQAGPRTGGGPGPEGCARGYYWQWTDRLHRRAASAPGDRGQGTEPRRAAEVLPDREARDAFGVVPRVGRGAVRQPAPEGWPAAQGAGHSEAGRRDGAGQSRLGLHEDPRRPSYRIEDRDRTDDGGRKVREDDQVRVSQPLHLLRRAASALRSEGVHGALLGRAIPSGHRRPVGEGPGWLRERQRNERPDRLSLAARGLLELLPSGSRMRCGDDFLDSTGQGGG